MRSLITASLKGLHISLFHYSCKALQLFLFLFIYRYAIHCKITIVSVVCCWNTSCVSADHLWWCCAFWNILKDVFSMCVLILRPLRWTFLWSEIHGKTRMSKSRFATHPIYFPFERVLLAISSVCVCVCLYKCVWKWFGITGAWQVYRRPGGFIRGSSICLSVCKSPGLVSLCVCFSLMNLIVWFVSCGLCLLRSEASATLWPVVLTAQQNRGISSGFISGDCVLHTGQGFEHVLNRKC